MESALEGGESNKKKMILDTKCYEENRPCDREGLNMVWRYIPDRGNG